MIASKGELDVTSRIFSYTLRSLKDVQGETERKQQKYLLRCQAPEHCDYNKCNP